MANKIISLRILPVILFFLCLHVLPGQSGYFIDDNARFVQRLTWVGSDYALRYEVSIEREEAGTYRNMVREFTENTFIEVSLPPGRYLLRVIPYDFRNLPSEGSAWRTFEILAALRPEINDFSPVVFYIKEGVEYTLDLYGSDFSPGAQIHLLRPDSEPIIPVQTDILQNGSLVRLLFNYDQLIPGTYIINIRNPGGLETSIGGFLIAIPDPESELEPVPAPEPVVRVRDPGPADIFIGAAFMPIFPLYNNNYSFDSTSSLSGAAFRLGIVSNNERRNMNTGLELAASWYDSGTMQAITAGLNFLAQKRSVNQVTALNFRFGAGYTMLLGQETQASALESIHTNLGVSFLWFIFDPLFLEFGLDHTHYFTEPVSGCFRPWFGLGVRF